MAGPRYTLRQYLFMAAFIRGKYMSIAECMDAADKALADSGWDPEEVNTWEGWKNDPRF